MSELRKDPIIGRWVIIATKRAKRPNDFLAKEPECNSCDKNNNSADIKNNFNPSEGFSHQIIDDHNCASSSPDCDFYYLFSSYKQRILEIKNNNKQIKYVVIFKNYKVKTNSKNLRHTNSNLIGLPVYPKNTKREIEGALKYYQQKKSCIYCDIMAQEKETGQRFIFENDNFMAISPFASRFPLETWILPKKHHSDYSEINQSQLRDLSAAFKKILLKMKSLLGDFPYTYTIHTNLLDKDKDSNISSSYHWYLEIIPLLTRVAGFEWGTGFYINPTPPESAAKYLSQAETKIKTE